MVNLNWKDKESSIRDLRKESSSFSELKDTKNIDELQIIESFSYPINENYLQQKEEKYLGSETEINNHSSDNWKNLLVWGDNQIVMPVLLKKFQNAINLIYIDPPFATGGNFYHKMHIGNNGPNSTVNLTAYNDIWRDGVDSYINFMYKRLSIMKELLADNGSIYVHLNWHSGHYIKIIMDEIFGAENFRNEVIWAFPAASVQTRNFFIRSYDVILFYTKSENYVFNDDPNIYMEFSDRVKFALKEDEQGTFYYRGGSHDGKKLSRKVYVKEKGIFPRDVWTDLPYIRANTIEYQGFSTQKPERLLKRILLASSNENDIVADFFCGTGTTLVTAEKLKRRWIGCDVAKHAISIARKRLLDVFNSNDLYNWSESYKDTSKPFDVLTTGKSKDNFEFQKEIFSNKAPNLSESPSFEVKFENNGLKATVKLLNYKNSLKDQLSEDISHKVHTWTDWIDSWSIDFNYKNKSFNSMWIAYRTPKFRELKTSSACYFYDHRGKYAIAVKVNDILGIETVQTYEFQIK